MMPATAWSRAWSPRAVSLGRRQIATCRTRATACAGWPAAGPGSGRSAAGPRARALQQRGDPPGQPPPAQHRRPHRGRPATPAMPSVLNRPIQRRTVAGWHSSSTAIRAAGNPCSDSSTITARAACRHWPRRSVRNRSTSLPGPLANTQTGCILTTTSPGGKTMEATSIQPPARLMSTPLARSSHPSWAGAQRGNGCRQAWRATPGESAGGGYPAASRVSMAATVTTSRAAAASLGSTVTKASACSRVTARYSASRSVSQSC
jgi:hypothetical protein